MGLPIHGSHSWEFWRLRRAPREADDLRSLRLCLAAGDLRDSPLAFVLHDSLMLRMRSKSSFESSPFFLSPGLRLIAFCKLRHCTKQQWILKHLRESGEGKKGSGISMTQTIN